jgi:hypothetical protein
VLNRDDRRDDPYLHGLNSWCQLVAFDSWIKLLEDSPRSMNFSEGIYFQDPTFTQMDVDLITSMGYTVVLPCDHNTRIAQNLVTPQTFLFNIIGNLKWLTLDALKVNTPALIIGHNTLEFNRHGRYFKRGPNDEQILYFDSEIWVWQYTVMAPHHLETAKSERPITRKFFSETLSRPLWKFTDFPFRDAGYVRGRAFEKKEDLLPMCRWTREMWAWWRPNVSSLLTRYEIEDDMECACYDCWARKKWEAWEFYKTP